jgi:hypothetical protein
MAGAATETVENPASEALAGRVTAHHRLLLTLHLEHVGNTLTYLAARYRRLLVRRARCEATWRTDGASPAAPMCPRRIAWLTSIPSSSRCPVATEWKPRIGRTRSLIGTWERSMAFVVSPRARCKPVRMCVARQLRRRTARRYAGCLSLITTVGRMPRRATA